MKKYIILLLSQVCVKSAIFASIYTGVSVGTWLNGDDTVIAAQAGYQFETDSNADLMVELEVGYWQDDLTDFGFYFDAEVIPVMANAKVAFPMADMLNCYAGIGAGMSSIEATMVTQAGGVTYSVSDDVFTYQFLLGVEFLVTQNFSLKAGYRYFRMNNVFDLDYGSGVLEGGFRFTF